MKTHIPAFMLVLLGAAAQGSAALTVVADLGGEPAAPYYDAVRPDERPLPPAITYRLAPFTENGVLPVTSPHLRPGNVVPSPLSMPGFSPLFLVGDDERSARWLAKNNRRLQNLHATGLVVNVTTAERLSALRRHAPELTLLPVSGEDLAARLQLTAYPVLITETGLSQ